MTRTPGAQLGPRVGGGIEDRGVEDGSSRDEAVRRPRAPSRGRRRVQRTPVADHLEPADADRFGSPRVDLQPLQRRDAARCESAAAGFVPRERARGSHEQDASTATGEMCCRRRSCRPRTDDDDVVDRGHVSKLALRVLRTLAGLAQAVLLALLHARVTREQSGLLQRRTEGLGSMLDSARAIPSRSAPACPDGPPPWTRASTL